MSAETVAVPDPAGPRAPHAALVYLSVLAYPHHQAKREVFVKAVRACMLRHSVYEQVCRQREPESQAELIHHADRYARNLFDAAALADYQRRPRDAEAAVKRGTRLIGQRANVAQVVFVGTLAKEPRVSRYTGLLARFSSVPNERPNVHSRYWNPALPVLHLAVALLPAIQRLQEAHNTKLIPLYQLVSDAQTWLPTSLAQAERIRKRIDGNGPVIRVITK